MANDLTEVVARAICRTYRLERKFAAKLTEQELEQEVSNTWELYRQEACAVITTLANHTQEEDGLVQRLLALRVRLKNGEYDGADLMRAWCAMMDAADRLTELNAQVAALKADCHAITFANDTHREECSTLRVRLGQAVRLLREIHAWDQSSAEPAYSLGNDITTFLAQIEQSNG